MASYDIEVREPDRPVRCLGGPEVDIDSGSRPEMGTFSPVVVDAAGEALRFTDRGTAEGFLADCDEDEVAKDLLAIVEAPDA